MFLVNHNDLVLFSSTIDKRKIVLKI